MKRYLVVVEPIKPRVLLTCLDWHVYFFTNAGTETGPVNFTRFNHDSVMQRYISESPEMGQCTYSTKHRALALVVHLI